MMLFKNLIALIFVACLCVTGAFGESAVVVISLDPQDAKAISPDLFGVFFEDINYAADGGLYAELIQNRSFEYGPTEQPSWNPLTSWELQTPGGGQGSVVVAAGRPLHPNNPHYAVLDVRRVGGGVGLSNAGFDGIPVEQGKAYNLSLFARQLYVERRWGGKPIENDDEFPLVVRLESPQGELLAEEAIAHRGREWRQLSCELTPSRTEPNARLLALSKTQGGVALDVISLFPKETFRGRENGLRKDLAQAIANLKPGFIRFPGGCLVHGDGLGNMYRWKDTIGPIHERRGQKNIWGYHQTVGLGYFEYFQFCEDTGAKPLPVVPAGVCCQNSGHTSGVGQDGLPMSEMPAYIQEVLDLIEWANGPTDSEWGAKRAAAGHPEPFELEYLGVGNEDHITPVFEQRFRMIYEAIAAEHPEITVIGTVGPAPDGWDYEQGWRIADKLRLPMVDEHYYRTPEWFLDNTRRYDAYDRGKSAVYLGEYAAHERDRRNTLRSALAEAAYMTGLERNGDLVRLASYAPLLAKRGRTQWTPDMIYFTNTDVLLTANYHAQRMFGQNQGEEFLRFEYQNELLEFAEDCFLSVVRDSESGDVCLKLVNLSRRPAEHRFEFIGGAVEGTADCEVLTGGLYAANDYDHPDRVTPTSSRLSFEDSLTYTAPPYSLSAIRVPGLPTD